MRIPNNKRWTQTNEGDAFGVLHETENLTFDKNGKLRLSRKAHNIYNSDNDDDFGYTIGIVYYNSNYIVVTTGNVFALDFASGGVTEITSGPNIVNNSDVTLCFNRVYVTADTSFSYYDGSFTNSLGSLTTGVPHPLSVFDSLTDYKLAVGDGNKVKLYNSSHVLYSVELTLPNQYQVTTLRYRNGYLYVGTRHIYGGEARVFIWDGATANANYDIPVGATWIFSMTEYQTTVAFVTSEGQLLLINGTSTQEIGAFPVYYEPDTQWMGSGGLQLNGKVFNRGMVTVGDTIYINVDGEVEFGYSPTMKSGLWVYDPGVGLYHRSHNSVDRKVVDTGLSLSNDTITTSSAHNLMTGDAVEFTTVSGLTNLTAITKYYVYVVSNTEIKLANSRKALKDGNYLTITGTPGVSDALVYVPNTDYFGGTNNASGAIAKTVYSENPLEMWRSPVVWGARFRDLDNGSFYAIQTFTDSWNIGRFTTQRIYAQSIKDSWKKLYTLIDGLQLTNETAIIKCKTTERIGYPTKKLQGTWLTSSTFNSNPDNDDLYPYADLELGDEITIVNGYGRGYTAHITKIEHESSVWSITVDEAIGTANGLIQFYAEPFKKLTTVTSSRNDLNIVDSTIGLQSGWIVFKVELRGFEPEVDHLILNSDAKEFGA